MSTLNINKSVSWADAEDNYETQGLDYETQPSTPVSGSTDIPRLSISENNLEINKFDNLTCYTFTECDENSPLWQQYYRGIIKNESGQVVCHSFGYTSEFSQEDIKELPCMNVICPILNNSKCYVSYEGSILRLFYNDSSLGKWQLSTHRKIDSFGSRWGSAKSYGQLFVDCLLATNKDLLTEDLKDINGNYVYENIIEKYANFYKLNKDYNYIFMITTSNENRIVCNSGDNHVLYFVGAFNTKNIIKTVSVPELQNQVEGVKDLPMFEYMSPESFEYIGVKLPILVSKMTVDEIKEYVKNMDYKQSQGVIFITHEGRTVKIVNDKYLYYSKLRGNNPNILLRYLVLQREGDKERVKQFVELYDDKKKLFIDFGQALDDICGNIYRKYRNRFVRKMVSIAPPEQYYVIRELHDQYLKDNTNIVTPQRVAKYVFDMQPERVYGLFHMYTKRKTETGYGNKLQDEFKNKVKDFVYQ